MSFLQFLRRVPLTRFSVQRYCSSSDAPIKYTTSKASSWKAEFTRSGETAADESASFQPLVVCASVAAFLLYFCVLREENDIDAFISTPLYDRIEGLEEVQLRTVLEYNLNNGLDVSKITARLREIEAAKAAKVEN